MLCNSCAISFKFYRKFYCSCDQSLISLSIIPSFVIGVLTSSFAKFNRIVISLLGTKLLRRCLAYQDCMIKHHGRWVIAHERVGRDALLKRTRSSSDNSIPIDRWSGHDRTHTQLLSDFSSGWHRRIATAKASSHWTVGLVRYAPLLFTFFMSPLGDMFLLHGKIGILEGFFGPSSVHRGRTHIVLGWNM